MRIVSGMNRLLMSALLCLPAVTGWGAGTSLSGVEGVQAELTESVERDVFILSADLNVEAYPPNTEGSPVFEASLPEPVRTEKIRFVSKASAIHVTEIRLYGPETTEYPPALWGKTVGTEAPNLATDAKVTASSEWEGRPASGVNDGMMTFGSRWYTGGEHKPPHWLVFDLGEKKDVDHIQMVSGYNSKGSTEWNGIAENFHFEFWRDGQWHRIETVEDAPRSPGAVALELQGADGESLVFLHNNARKRRFAIARRGAEGLEVLKDFAPTRLDEPQKGLNLRLEVRAAGPFQYFLCNGRKVGQLDLREHEMALALPLRASLRAASPDTNLRLVNYAVQYPVAKDSGLLGALSLTAPDSDQPLESDFDPFREDILVRLTESHESLQLKLRPLPGTRVLVDGEETGELILDAARIASGLPLRIQALTGSGMGKEYVLQVTPIPPAGNLKLEASDEFDGESLDLDRWIYRRGLRWESLNTPEAVSVGDGKLRITLRVDDQGRQLVGGIISKKAYGYGYMETRAKLTHSVGWHSAFWSHGLKEGMQEMGSAEAERTGSYIEIDCFESTSGNAFSTNLHSYSHGFVGGTGKIHQANVADEFHTYGWLWTPSEVCYYFDGEMIDRRNILPPIRPQNVWLTCVAHPGAETEDLPQEILFDYFRYYAFERPADGLSEDAIIVAPGMEGYSETGAWSSAEDDKAQSWQLELSTRRSVVAGSSCQWKFQLPEEGRYEVFIWNPYVSIDPVINERGYLLQTADGPRRASYNPRIAGQDWASLGVYVFNAQALVSLPVLNDGVYRADAVAMLPVEKSAEAVAAGRELPRVLIIGDSISMGYAPPLGELLAGKAEVNRPDANCGSTKVGLRDLDKWLGDGRWDVIHFNFGLHDLRQVFEGDRFQDAEGHYPVRGEGMVRTTPEDYERNLRRLVARLKQTGARLVWASTTPLVKDFHGYFQGREALYNKIAARVMQEEGVLVDDLWSHAAPQIAAIQLPDGNPHFTRTGSKFLAEKVADAVLGALQQ